MPLPMIASLTLLIFCLDFFSITAYLNDSAGHLLMQIKYAFTHPLGVYL